VCVILTQDVNKHAFKLMIQTSPGQWCNCNATVTSANYAGWSKFLARSTGFFLKVGLPLQIYAVPLCPRYQKLGDGWTCLRQLNGAGVYIMVASPLTYKKCKLSNILGREDEKPNDRPKTQESEVWPSPQPTRGSGLLRSRPDGSENEYWRFTGIRPTACFK